MIRELKEENERLKRMSKGGVDPSQLQEEIEKQKRLLEEQY